MRLCSIASGSSGNCIYVGSDTTHLLVDDGIAGKRVEAGLKELDLCFRDLDGVLITHEHSDHIGGLGVLLRKHAMPVYCTEGTRDAILCCSSMGKVDPELFHLIRPDEKFTIRDITVDPMRISHDAADPVAYRFLYGKQKIAVVTDLGKYDEYTVDCLKNTDVLMLEANHDVRMLESGPYPYQLKRRILGDRGHLSNDSSGELLCRLLHDNMKAVILGHLSKENNMPEIAYETVRQSVDHSEIPYMSSDFKMLVAKRSEVTQAIDLG
ncbi:MAG: MBL fold metallo-hydrolase [Lachnospiraceae bacterium]|nr:MBL fold metallo-hydrolase [Lachnospiraceae bacterium]